MSARTWGPGLLALLLVALAFVAWREQRGAKVPQETRASEEEGDAAVAARGLVEPLALVPGEHEPRQGEPEIEPESAATVGIDVPRAVVRATEAPVQCVLYGTVLDAAGTAISPWEPSVSMTDSAGKRVNTTASLDGHYSLAGLAPGAWSLSVLATGYRTQSAPVELTLVEPIVRRDLVLGPAVQLPVRLVTSSGELLRDALKARGDDALRGFEWPLPVATLEAPGATIGEANNAGNNQVGVGRFWDNGPLWERLGPEYCGVLVLSVDLPVHVSLVVGARVLSTQRVEPGSESVTFVVEPESLFAALGRVRARFLAADTGAALNGMLAIDPLEWSMTVREGLWEKSLPPGEYTLRFWCSGYARIPLEITLAAGQELDLGDVVLPLGLTIQGRLLDAEGNPVFARLELGTRDAQGVLRFRDHWYYDSDATGAYEIGGLVPGRYVLRTVGDDQVTFPGRDELPTVWVSGNVPVSTLGGSVTGFDVSLVKGGVLVLAGAGTLPLGTRCRILDAQGDLLRSKSFYEGFVPRFLLPPGRYTLVLLDEERNELRRHALEIGAGVTEFDLAR